MLFFELILIIAVFFAETINAAFRVHKFLFTRKKRMADGADFHADILLGGTRFNTVSAGACDGGLLVIRVNAFFHRVLLNDDPKGFMVCCLNT